jgi:hypothetical protein
MLRIFQLLLLTIVVACQATGENSGGMISGHRSVENAFTVSVPSPGSRLAGNILTFTLTFPYPVTVAGGPPRLTLDVGGTTRYANYASGSGSTELIFNHTVDAADNDTDGIEVTPAIDLNGGTLTYTGTNGVDNCSVTLTIPDTSRIKIDNTVPTVSLVAAPSNATYYLNMPMLFTVTMSKATLVTGTPRLVLDVGGVTKYANYVSGSGSTSLIFLYTVASGDIDLNGIQISTPVDLNGGTLKDSLSNNATLNLVAPNTTAVLVNGNAPYVTSVTPPANGNYGLGSNLDFVFTYSEPVTVSGTPTLSLTIGSTTRLASYYSGSGSTQLTFRYVVQVGEVDSNGIASASSFGLTGAWIRDGSSTNALNAFTMPSLTGVLVVDDRPVVSSFLVNNGTYYIDDPFTFTALFSEPVTVTGTPRIPMTLNVGGPVYATYVSGSGTTNIIFTYTVVEGIDDNNGVVITSPVDLNSGTIKSLGGVDANLTFTQPSTGSLRISGIRPTITSVTAPANGSYLTGENLDFIVNFSENVTAGSTGNIKLNLTIGATAKQANYLSGSGTTALTFRYTIVGGDQDTDGISIGTIALTGAGYINDGGTTANTADLTFSPPNTSEVLVNSTVPVIDSVTSPADATYLFSQNIDFILTYSEAVTVSGSPRLALTVGASTLYAAYSSGSGTSSLTFRYTVADGHTDTDGITAAAVLDNNGGSILSALTVPAATGVPAQTLTGVLVDGTVPAITGSTKPTDGIYTFSDTSLTFTVTWDDLVFVTGTPRLTLTVGSTTRYADYSSGSGTNTLTFVYAIDAADLDLDGLAIATSIDLNLGSILDDSGNPAELNTGAQNLSGVLINFDNMLTWWDMDDSSTISTSVCGAAYCATQVADKSGGTIHATASGAARPEYVSSGFGLGNTGYLQFDNLNMVMGASAGLNPVRTVFIVFQTEVAAMTTQDIFYQNGLAVRTQVTNLGDLTLGVVGAYSLNGSGLAGSASTFAAGMVSNSSYILAVRYGGGYNFSIPGLGSTNFGGKIAEVLVYSNALSPAQAAAIEAYLNTKHQVH